MSVLVIWLSTHNLIISICCFYKHFSKKFSDERSGWCPRARPLSESWVRWAKWHIIFQEIAQPRCHTCVSLPRILSVVLIPRNIQTEVTYAKSVFLRLEWHRNHPKGLVKAHFPWLCDEICRLSRCGRGLRICISIGSLGNPILKSTTP